MENHENELYIFGPDDQLITTITEETGLYTAPFREGINQVSSFSFTVDATAEAAAHVVEENQVVFRDKEGDLRLFVIKEPTDRDGPDGPLTEAVCEPWYMELKEHIVLDRRFVDQTADVALNAALEGTRATGRVIGEFGRATTNFYRLPAIDAIWEIPNVWGGELKDVVEFDGSRITARRMELHMRRGADRGKVFEIDHDIEEIERAVLSYPLTAMYGWGASLEIEDDQGEHTGGYTRYIDFADVEWSKAKGDPVDKPKGQKWVGDPAALQRYGRPHNGGRLHRYGQYSNQDIEDPAELLMATWLHLQNVKEPEVNYQLSVALLEQLAGYEHERVQLGDTAAAIDREFSREIVIQSRVISIEYDILDIEGTAVVEMGQFLSVHDQNLGREIDDLKAELNDTRAQANRPITNDRFPDIKPGTPSNVQAIGGFQVIQLYWNYDSNVNIAHYEVYGSQVASFVPDSQHLLYRGRTSAFAHEVNTDETWYYYVRAVNQRGTPGDYSSRASAATVRLISDDILFGAVTAEHLSGNLDIADKLAQNTVDRINSGPMQEISYTRDEITATETRLNTRLNKEIGDVNGAVATLTGRADALSKRADAVDASLTGHGNRLTEVETDIDSVNGKISASLTSIERIDGTVNQHTATLTAQATAIAAKVDNLTYQRDMSGAISRIDSAETSIDILASGLELRVTKEEFEALQVGGRNLLKNSVAPVKNHSGGTWSSIAMETPFGQKEVNVYTATGTSSLIRFQRALTQQGTFTFSVYAKTVNEGTIALVEIDINDHSPSITKTVGNTWERISVTTEVTRITDVYHFVDAAVRTLNVPVAIAFWQLEKGNRATDWTPAPEDADAAINTISNRVTTTETTLKTHAGLISAKAELKDVYTKTEVNSALGQKVDTTVYNTKMGQLDVSINGITGRVASTETNINSLTGQMISANSQIAALDIKANSITQSVSEIRTDLVEKTTIKDTRNDNQPPSWYWEKYKKQTVEEFKLRTAMGVSKGETYGTLTTIIPWIDSSGGYIKQTFRIGDFIFERRSNGNSTWSAWKEVENVEGAQAKVNTAVTTLNASISTLAGQVELKASQTSVNSLTNRLTTAEGTLAVLPGQIDLKVNKNGVIAGINVSSEGVRINGARIHLTGQTLIDDAIIGTAALANLSVSRAKIQTAAVGTLQVEDGSIINAKIANLAVDDAKIANVSVAKLKAGMINADQVGIANSKIQLDNTGLYVYARAGIAGASLVEGNLTFNDQANGQRIGRFAATVWSDNLTKGVSINMEPNRYISFGHYTGASTGYTPMVVFNPGTAMAGVPRGLVSNLPYRANDDVWMGTYALRFGLNNNHNHHAIYNSSGNDLLIASYQTIGLATVSSGQVTSTRFSVDAAVNHSWQDLDLHGWKLLRVGEVDMSNWGRIVADTSATYVQHNTEVRATKYKSTTLVPMIASSFNTSSLASTKQDIEQWTDDALEEIRRTTLYRYRLKSEVSDGIAHDRYGFVIGNGSYVPSQVLSRDGKGIDSYAHSSLNTQAIKELDHKQTDLEGRVSMLELENQYLKQKIKALECA